MADTDPVADTDTVGGPVVTVSTDSADTDPDTDPVPDTDLPADSDNDGPVDTDPSPDTDTDGTADTDPADTDAAPDTDTDTVESLAGTGDTSPSEPRCVSIDPACWVVVDPSDAQSLEIQAQAPVFLRTIAPLDAEVGELTTVRFVVMDGVGNPSRVTGTVQPRANGFAVGDPVVFDDDWQGETVLTPQAEGPIVIRGNPDFTAEIVSHWSMVHPAGSMPTHRLVGDLHAHSGGDGSDAFGPTALGGDHRGNFTRGVDTLRYMHRVAGLDFGALAEHAVTHRDFALPSGDFSAFEADGPCEVEPDVYAEAPDWWTLSQSDAAAFDAAWPGFTAFPAYEWHGSMKGPQLDARLHRIVAYRDHHPLQGWPMLPGTTENRPPQCLFHFLEASGATPDDVAVLPHMMYARRINLDWDITYDPEPPYDTLATLPPDTWQRVGEMFSARNYGAASSGEALLTAFEGPADPDNQPWTFRYGWRDAGATIGILGASNDHTQMAGSDDLFRQDGTSDHTHEPGGFAVVLTEGDDPRAGIFDGLQARATYATSGPRAWLEFYVDDGGDRHIMGSELATDACKVDGASQLMVGRSIRSFVIWAAPVGGAADFTPIVSSIGPNVERMELPFSIDSPLAAFPNAPTRWLYYVRAFVGAPVEVGQTPAEIEATHQDAVWSSPIWIDWSEPTCP
jgi:hypothetical protein